MNTATGTFTVSMTPQPADDHADAALMGRMHLDKVFSGDMIGTGKGQMLTGMSATPGSGAYVAIEEVSATIDGKQGTFKMVHRGIMNKGAQELLITIVPDTGTGELEGISGECTIRIENGTHYYDLTYSL